MNRVFAALVVVACAAVTVLAQGGSKNVVSVSAVGPTDPVAAGYSFQVAVLLQVKAGYHINAQKPSEDYLIGTRLTLTPPKGMKVSKVSYPRAKMASFEFSETPLAVYDGAVELVATLRTDKSLDVGDREIAGKVTFQACNDQSCLPPSTVEVTATVRIVEPEEKVAGSLTITGAPPGARVSVDGRSAGSADAQGRLAVRSVETGRRRIRVEAEGFAPFERTVTVDESSPAAVAVAMTATETAPAPAEPVAASQATPPSQPSATPPSPQPPAEAESGGLSIAMFALIGALTGAAIAGIFILARKRAGMGPTPQAK
jgi:hypothetical protein